MKTVSLALRSRPEWFCLVLLVLGVQAIRPLRAMAKEADELAAQAVTEMNAVLSKLNKGDLAGAKASLEKADELLNKIKEVDPKFSRLQMLRQRYDTVKQKVAGAASRPAEPPKPTSTAPASQAAGPDKPAKPTPDKALCEAWLAKLNPYITPTYRGGSKEKYLIPSATQEKEEFANRQRIYGEASGVFEAYRKVEFPGGKTRELQQAEEALAKALKDFGASCIEYAKASCQEADTQIKGCEDFLARQEAKKDPKDPPLPLQKDELRRIYEILAYAETAAKDDPRIAALRARMAAIEQRDIVLRRTRIEQTTMRPDQFKGAEIKDLKAKAGEIVQKKLADAKVLRTTIVSPDWKEESVIEATDTTNTALRHRVTRSVTAQVAAKVGADVNLYTLDISKDRRSDGTWGELYGHIMFTDPMLEKNVRAEGQ